MVAMAESDATEIGRRIQVGEHRGTVRYVGPVPPTKGIWLGIDWDDPTRGKHDGVYNGVRYFTARFQTSGSLVRPEKVDFGQTAAEAVTERYGGSGQQMDEETRREIQKALKASVFEFVGFENRKHQNFQNLKIVGLRELRVSSAGTPGELARICPHTIDLNLSKNIISSWKDILEITLDLNLVFLDVSENRLSYSESDFSSIVFPELKFLNLSRMEYNWDDIVHICQMTRRLQSLQVSFNKLTVINSLLPDALHSLKAINIEGNDIRHWSEIQKLGSLSMLESLNASSTGLSRISIDPDSFPSLKFINLSQNFIQNWESISELDRLPQLDEFRFRDNPVLDGLEKATARQIIIARISRLKVLNSQDIPPDERRGAEYDYLKKTAQAFREWATNSDEGKISFATFHPRYETLIKKYGGPEESELKVQSTALNSTLNTVILQSGEKTIERRLPREMTVKTLKNLVRRLFSLCSAPELTLVSAKNSNLRSVLDNDMKSLSYYSVEDKDTIIVM